mgnify:CR=1 FL=1
MDNITILKQLLNGHHLEPKELIEAKNLLLRLTNEVKSRLTFKEELTKDENNLYIKLFYYMDRDTSKNYIELRNLCNCFNYDTLFNSILNRGYIKTTNNPKEYLLT